MTISSDHTRRIASLRLRLMRASVLAPLLASLAVVAGPAPLQVAAATTVLGTSTSSQAYQRPAQDKVAVLHDGSLLVGFYDGSKVVIDQVKTPGTAPATTQVQTFTGSDEVTIYTLPGASSTDVWVQAGNEFGGSAPLEEIRHATYNGTAFTWDALTTIPGSISPGRQDPSLTWTGKWLIATWWDDTLGANSDVPLMNWTADKTGTSGWLGTAIQFSAVSQTVVQVSVRHSAKLGATIVAYGDHSKLWTRTLLDSKTDPSLTNWTAESAVDPAFDDSEAGFGGPQIAIDENNGNIHVFRAVTNQGGPGWHGVTYWLGTPDAVPMSSGGITWGSRVVIDSTASACAAPPAPPCDPPDIAGAVDSKGTVYVFWVTKVSSGSLKYVTLVSPYTTPSSAITLVSSGQPRFPHVPAEFPLNRGYVPLVYQTGTSSPFSIVLDTSIPTAPSVPTGLAAAATPAQVNLSWKASIDDLGVAGYTIYRNGAVLTTVSGTTLTYADNTVVSLNSYTYTVDAFDSAGNHSAKSAPVTIVVPEPPTYTAVTPVRLLDTRSAGGPVGPAGAINLTVAGVTPGAPANASAVVLNVTVTNTTAPSFLTIYPAGGSLPLASNLNWTAGKTIANLVEVPVGAAGAITIYNSAGSTDVVVDLEGYFAPPTGSAGSEVALTPARITDTRSASGFPNAGSTLGPATSLDVQVTGAGLVPSAGVSGAILNVTVTNTTAPGFLTVWPTGQGRPLASNLNWTAHQTVPNRVFVPVGAGGKVSIYNSGGSTDVVVDVSGYFTDSTAAGNRFTPQSPVRIKDTRTSGQTLGPGGTFNLQVGGVAGVPANAKAVILNVTATNTTAPSFLTVYPSAAARPTASDLNWVAGQTVPNLTVATLDSSGSITFYNSAGSTDVVVDLFGYFRATAGVVVAASPASIAANGTATSTVTATVTLANGSPATADQVTFTTSGGTSCGTITGSPATTNGSGVATVTYTASTTAGTCTITATEANAGSSNTAAITQT